jgi:hypothetical protein
MNVPIHVCGRNEKERSPDYELVRTVQQAAAVYFKILPQHLLGRTKDIQNLSPVVSVNHFTIDLPCFTDRQLQFVHSSTNFSQMQIANVFPSRS